MLDGHFAHEGAAVSCERHEVALQSRCGYQRHLDVSRCQPADGFVAADCMGGVAYRGEPQVPGRPPRGQQCIGDLGERGCLALRCHYPSVHRALVSGCFDAVQGVLFLYALDLVLEHGADHADGVGCGIGTVLEQQVPGGVCGGVHRMLQAGYRRVEDGEPFAEDLHPRCGKRLRVGRLGHPVRAPGAAFATGVPAVAPADTLLEAVCPGRQAHVDEEIGELEVASFFR